MMGMAFGFGLERCKILLPQVYFICFRIVVLALFYTYYLINVLFIELFDKPYGPHLLLKGLLRVPVALRLPVPCSAGNDSVWVVTKMVSEH